MTLQIIPSPRFTDRILLTNSLTHTQNKNISSNTTQSIGATTRVDLYPNPAHPEPVRIPPANPVILSAAKNLKWSDKDNFPVVMKPPLILSLSKGHQEKPGKWAKGHPTTKRHKNARKCPAKKFSAFVPSPLMEEGWDGGKVFTPATKRRKMAEKFPPLASLSAHSWLKTE